MILPQRLNEKKNAFYRLFMIKFKFIGHIFIFRQYIHDAIVTEIKMSGKEIKISVESSILKASYVQRFSSPLFLFFIYMQPAYLQTKKKRKLL